VLLDESVASMLDEGGVLQALVARESIGLEGLLEDLSGRGASGVVERLGLERRVVIEALMGEGMPRSTASQLSRSLDYPKAWSALDRATLSLVGQRWIGAASSMDEGLRVPIRGLIGLVDALI